jgi:hypothetical protein
LEQSYSRSIEPLTGIKSLVKFFASLIAVAAAIAGLVLIGANGGYFSKPSFFFKTLLFLLFSTSLIYVYLYKAKNQSFFIQLYLLTMAVKLLAYCAYILIVILHDKRAAIGNVIFFMVTYFVFTSLEIGFLYAKISRKNRL